MSITQSLAREVGIRPACNALDVSRAGFYRWRHPKEKEPSCRLSPLALSFEERNDVLDILHEDRFVDRAPREIYAALLDEKSYLCSVRTMYRVLEKEGPRGEDEGRCRHRLEERVREGRERCPHIRQQRPAGDPQDRAAYPRDSLHQREL